MFCAPPPPPVVGGGDGEDVDWVARGLSSSGGGSIVESTLRRSLASLSPSGGGCGGGAGRLAEFLAGVRRTSIEAGRYKAGWTAMAGDWTTALRMPPRCISEEGLSSRHLSMYP